MSFKINIKYAGLLVLGGVAAFATWQTYPIVGNSALFGRIANLIPYTTSEGIQIPGLDKPVDLEIAIPTTNVRQVFVPVANVKKSMSFNDMEWSPDLLEDPAFDTTYRPSDLVAIKMAYVSGTQIDIYVLAKASDDEVSTPSSLKSQIIASPVFSRTSAAFFSVCVALLAGFYSFVSQMQLHRSQTKLHGAEEANTKLQEAVTAANRVREEQVKVHQDGLHQAEPKLKAAEEAKRNAELAAEDRRSTQEARINRLNTQLNDAKVLMQDTQTQIANQEAKLKAANEAERAAELAAEKRNTTQEAQILKLQTALNDTNVAMRDLQTQTANQEAKLKATDEAKLEAELAAKDRNTTQETQISKLQTELNGTYVAMRDLRAQSARQEEHVRQKLDAQSQALEEMRVLMQEATNSRKAFEASTHEMQLELTKNWRHELSQREQAMKENNELRTKNIELQQRLTKVAEQSKVTKFSSVNKGVSRSNSDNEATRPGQDEGTKGVLPAPGSANAVANGGGHHETSKPEHTKRPAEGDASSNAEAEKWQGNKGSPVQDDKIPDNRDAKTDQNEGANGNLPAPGSANAGANVGGHSETSKVEKSGPPAEDGACSNDQGETTKGKTGNPVGDDDKDQVAPVDKDKNPHVKLPPTGPNTTNSHQQPIKGTPTQAAPIEGAKGVIPASDSSKAVANKSDHNENCKPKPFNWADDCDDPAEDTPSSDANAKNPPGNSKKPANDAKDPVQPATSDNHPRVHEDHPNPDTHEKIPKRSSEKPANDAQDPVQPAAQDNHSRVQVPPSSPNTTKPPHQPITTTPATVPTTPNIPTGPRNNITPHGTRGWGRGNNRGPNHRGPNHRGPNHRGPNHRGPNHRGSNNRGSNNRGSNGYEPPPRNEQGQSEAALIAFRRLEARMQAHGRGNVG